MFGLFKRKPVGFFDVATERMLATMQPERADVQTPGMSIEELHAHLGALITQGHGALPLHLELDYAAGQNTKHPHSQILQVVTHPGGGRKEAPVFALRPTLSLAHLPRLDLGYVISAQNCPL